MKILLTGIMLTISLGAQAQNCGQAPYLLKARSSFSQAVQPIEKLNTKLIGDQGLLDEFEPYSSPEDVFFVKPFISAGTALTTKTIDTESVKNSLGNLLKKSMKECIKMSELISFIEGVETIRNRDTYYISFLKFGLEELDYQKKLLTQVIEDEKSIKSAEVTDEVKNEIYAHYNAASIEEAQDNIKSAKEQLNTTTSVLGDVLEGYEPFSTAVMFAQANVDLHATIEKLYDAAVLSKE